VLHIDLSTNSIPIGSDDRRVSLYFTMGCPFSPQNLPLPIGGSDTWFPRPTQVLNPKGSLIGAAVFAGLTSVTDRQTDRPTDHATRSVRIGRIYVRSTVMRPNNNNTLHSFLYCHKVVTSEAYCKLNIHQLTAIGKTEKDNHIK